MRDNRQANALGIEHGHCAFGNCLENRDRGSRNARALATEGLVARGGFRDGQTAKARKGRRVQSLPVGRGHQLKVAHRSKEYPLVPENEMLRIL